MVTLTALCALWGPKEPGKNLATGRGIEAPASLMLLQQSQGRHILASRQSGVATCTFARGFVEETGSEKSFSAPYSDENTFTLPSAP